MFLPIGDDVERDHPPVVGLGLVLACIVVWVHSLKVHANDPLPFGEDLMAWYTTWGLSGKDLVDGKFAKVFTHMFVHAGFLHLLGNMVAFWAFVWTLEAVMGSLRFLALYVICGLLAGAAHAFFNGPESTIPLVGASGAIAGVIGAYCLKFGPTTNIKCLVFLIGRPFKVSLPAASFAGIWILTQLYGQMTSDGDGGGVAWLAHLVGFAAGTLLVPLLCDDSTGELTEDKDGTLVVKKKGKGDEVVDPRKLPFAFDVESQVQACHGCGRELDVTCRVSPGLWMCPDAACKRLTYATTNPLDENAREARERLEAEAEPIAEPTVDAEPTMEAEPVTDEEPAADVEPAAV